MARLASDFLPLNGTSFFNMTGEMPPQLRVLLHIPEDFQEMFSTRQDFWEKDEAQAWYENQDRFKNIIIERYRNMVQGRLANVRRGKNLSEIGIYRQQLELASGVTMEYTSLWGREYVTLTFAEWLVRKLVEQIMKEEANQCLLVLYGDDKIAAFYMSDVYKGEIKTPIYKARMKTPYEDVEAGKQYPTVQELLAKDKLFTNTSFDISNKVKCPKHDSVWLLVNYWGVRKVGLGYLYDDHPTIDYLNFNGDGNNVYTLTYTYSYSENDHSLQETGTVDRAGDIGTPTAVDSSGEIGYSKNEGELDSKGYGTTSYKHKIMQTATGDGKPAVEPPTVITKVAKTTVSPQHFSTPSQRIEYHPNSGGTGSCPNGTPPTIATDSWPSEYKKTIATFDGELLYETGHRQDGTTKGQSFWIATYVDTFGPLDLSVNFGPIKGIIWSWAQSSGGSMTTYRAGSGNPPDEGSTFYPVGFNTAIWNDSPNASNVFTTDYDLVVINGQGGEWAAGWSEAFCHVCHISTDVSVETIPGMDIPVYKPYSIGDKSISPEYFPYAVDGKIWAIVTEGDVTHLQTPYEDVQCSTSHPYFRGWLNLHNGGTLIQGGLLTDGDAETTLLYIDGERKDMVGSIELSEIKTIFIDIPLRLIKRWATKAG